MSKFSFMAVVSMAVIVALCITFGCSLNRQSSSVSSNQPAYQLQLANTGVDGAVDRSPFYKGLTDGQVLDVIRQHAKFTSPPPSNDKRGNFGSWDLVFETSGSTNGFDQVLGVNGPTLGAAANAYALYTLDFNVTMQDLVDSGFWPYKVFPAGVDLSQNIDPGTWESISGSPDFLSELPGTAKWLLITKAAILTYYFEAIDVSQSSKELETQLTTNMNPKFFWNPFKARQMMQGPSLGDYMSGHIGDYLHRYEEQPNSYNLSIPVLNLSDMSHAPMGGADNSHMAMSESPAKGTSDTLSCCPSVSFADHGTGGQSQSTQICCACGEAMQCCDITWKYNCEWWSTGCRVLIGCVDCGTTDPQLTMGRLVVDQEDAPTSYALCVLQRLPIWDRAVLNVC